MTRYKESDVHMGPLMNVPPRASTAFAERDLGIEHNEADISRMSATSLSCNDVRRAGSASSSWGKVVFTQSSPQSPGVLLFKPEANTPAHVNQGARSTPEGHLES